MLWFLLNITANNFPSAPHCSHGRHGPDGVLRLILIIFLILFLPGGMHGQIRTAPYFEHWTATQPLSVRS